MAAAGFRFQYRLRTLFVVLTLMCPAALAARAGFLHRQASHHHRQVEAHVRQSEHSFHAGRPFSRERWADVRRQLNLACAYDHASCHPWLTLAEAHAEVQQQSQFASR